MEFYRGDRVVVTNRAVSKFNGRTGVVKGWSKWRMVRVQLDGETWETEFADTELAPIYTLSKS